MIADLSTIKFRAVKFHINPVVIGTFARLHGTLAFVETMNDGIPAVEEIERRYLEQLALDDGDYAVERGILGQNFHSWIPTFAAYSVQGHEEMKPHRK